MSQKNINYMIESSTPTDPTKDSVKWHVSVWLGENCFHSKKEGCATSDEAKVEALEKAIEALLSAPRIVRVDSYDREHIGMGDSVVATMGPKANSRDAQLLLKALQDNPARRDEDWYELVDANHKLRIELP